MTRFVAIIISLLFFVSCVSGRVLVDADHKDESKNAPSIRIPNVITSDGATKKVSMKLAFWTNEVFADIMDQIAIHAGDGKFRFVHSMLFTDEAPRIVNNDEFRCKIAYDLIPQFINEGYRARIVSQKRCSRRNASSACSPRCPAVASSRSSMSEAMDPFSFPAKS